MKDRDNIEKLLRHSKEIKPSERTNIKLGSLVRIVSILESMINVTPVKEDQTEVERLNKIIQQYQKEHKRLIEIIRSQDKEIKRLFIIIKEHEASTI